MKPNCAFCANARLTFGFALHVAQRVARYQKVLEFSVRFSVGHEQVKSAILFATSKAHRARSMQVRTCFIQPVTIKVAKYR